MWPSSSNLDVSYKVTCNWSADAHDAEHIYEWAILKSKSRHDSEYNQVHEPIDQYSDKKMANQVGPHSSPSNQVRIVEASAHGPCELFDVPYHDDRNCGKDTETKQRCNGWVNSWQQDLIDLKWSVRELDFQFILSSNGASYWVEHQIAKGRQCCCGCCIAIHCNTDVPIICCGVLCVLVDAVRSKYFAFSFFFHHFTDLKQFFANLFKVRMDCLVSKSGGIVSFCHQYFIGREDWCGEGVCALTIGIQRIIVDFEFWLFV